VALMSTRTCPSCGAEYLGWVTRCSECGVALGPEGPSVLDLPEDDQIVYELGEWPPALRDAVAARLQADGVAFAWEGTDLVVHVDDEDHLDAVVAELDPDQAEGAGTGGDRGQLVYDLSEWAGPDRARLGAALDEAGIPYAWEPDGSLVVPAADEHLVEAVLDSVEYPDALEADLGDDGADAQEVLSDLFLAADRLQHDPQHPEGVGGLYDTVPLALGMQAPYGVAEPTWRQLVDGARALFEAVQAGDDDAVVGAAAALRAGLRPLV